MSSSSDEVGANPAPPRPVVAPVAKARASSPDTSSDEELAAVKPWLDKVLDAFINLSTEDPAKGVSIVKVKKYLKEKYRVGKIQMVKVINPALKVATARKYIIKTTVLHSAVMGSARLNPGYAISRLRHSGEEGGAATEEEKGGAGGGRKRKAGAVASADEEGTKGTKRRLPFGKVN